MSITKKELMMAIESLNDDALVIIEHADGIQQSTVESVSTDKHGRLVIVESK